MTESLINLQPDQVEYPNKDFFAELVGEGRKFKDEKELAKGKYYSDQLIKTYEVKMDQMAEDMIKLREENAAKKRMEELINDYQTLRQATPEQPTLVPDKSPSIKKEDIESLVDTRLSQREQVRKQQDNQNFVKTKLIENYGQNYSPALVKTLSELDMSEAYFNDMARNNPKALIKMLGISDAAPTHDPFRAPPRSNQVQSQYTPQTEERTWSYYQKMKEDNPRKYYDRATNIQMHNDALRLGDRFEDGDFNKYAKDYRISF